VKNQFLILQCPVLTHSVMFHFLSGGVRLFNELCAFVVEDCENNGGSDIDYHNNTVKLQ